MEEKRKKQTVARIVKFCVIVILLLVILVPLIWILSLSIRYNEDVFEILPKKGFTLHNFPEAVYQTDYWAGLTFFRMFGNSALVSATSIVVIIVISVLAAFGFSNYTFKGKEIFFIAFLLGFMIPVQVLLIPLFVLMKNLSLLNTYFVLILPYAAFGFPIGTLILRSFFEKIPFEIKESAKIDGARDFTILTKIVLPLGRPALATVVIFNFLVVWNEFLFALVFIRKDFMRTIPVVLNRMIYNPYGIVQYEVYSAMIVLTLIPTLIIFILFQKWFIAGLSSGALKG